MPVKGLAEPIPVYEIIGAGSARTRLQAAAARGLSRFVGRDEELGQLRRALERAGAGHGQVVAVVGEPGVGESRLFHEVMHSHRTQGWLVLEAAAASHGKATSYLPAVDMLRGYFGIESLGDQRAIREKVTGRLLALDRALESALPPCWPCSTFAAATRHGTPSSHAERRRSTLDAVKRLLLRESQVQPLVLIVEDLHWLDAESQALLDSLVESLPAARILLLVNYRPEYAHAWGSKTSSRRSAWTCCRRRVPTTFCAGSWARIRRSTRSRRCSWARTEGNPLFLEECVRALVETGALDGAPGARQLARPVESLEVPVTVQAILAARIDRLPAAEKRLLSSRFRRGQGRLPGAPAGGHRHVDPEDLPRLVERLRAAEFLYEARLFPDPEYTFTHALTHEVAYGTLLQDRRRDLHARIARAIESLSQERRADQVERLAHHSVRGEIWDLALTYLREAAHKALARSAHREATAHLEQALEALGHLPDTRGDKGAGRRPAAGARPRPRHGGALSRGPAAHDRRRASRRGLGRPDPAGTSPAAKVPVDPHVRRLRPGPGRGAPRGRGGGGGRGSAAPVRDAPSARPDHLGVGDSGAAVDLLRRSVAALGDLAGTTERSGYVRGVGPHAWLGYALGYRGEFDQGISCGQHALRLAESGARPGNLLAALGTLGLTLVERGDHRGATEVLERGLRLCETWKILDWSITIESALGLAWALAGRFEEAILLQRRAEAEEPHAPQGFPAARMLRSGETCWLAGRIDDARGPAKRACDWPGRRANAAARCARSGSWAMSSPVATPVARSGASGTGSRWPMRWGCAAGGSVSPRPRPAPRRSG